MMYDDRQTVVPADKEDSAIGEQQPETLRIEGLTLRYGAVLALQDIDLKIGAGEFVAVLGPSGCGKTSLLRAVAGFNTPQEGRIVLKNQDVADLPPRSRNIGIVFQNYALFPHMTAYQNVAFGLECRRLSRPEIHRLASEALEKVRLGNLADRRPKALSGGQQQRVALARAIVIEPDLLLLDEPLGALDKQLRLRMQTELKDLQRDLGITAIFVTHDQQEAVAMADRIVVMRDGRIQQVAAPDALFARPANAWVADFIDAGNLLSGEVIKGENRQWSLRLTEDTVFTAPAPQGATPDNVSLLIPQHVLQVTPVGGPSPFTVSSVQPSGLTFTAHIRWNDEHLRAQLPIERIASLQPGTQVRLGAAPDAGLWLAGG